MISDIKVEDSTAGGILAGSRRVKCTLFNVDNIL